MTSMTPGPDHQLQSLELGFPPLPPACNQTQTRLTSHPGVLRLCPSWHSVLCPRRALSPGQTGRVCSPEGPGTCIQLHQDALVETSNQRLLSTHSPRVWQAQGSGAVGGWNGQQPFAPTEEGLLRIQPAPRLHPQPSQDAFMPGTVPRHPGPLLHHKNSHAVWCVNFQAHDNQPKKMK